MDNPLTVVRSDTALSWADAQAGTPIGDAIREPEYAVVIAYDPGQTSGWCAMEYKPSEPDVAPKVLGAGQCETWATVPFLLGIYAGYGQQTSPLYARPVVFVVEDFRLRAKEGPSLIGDQFIAPQVIGVIRYLCGVAGVEVVFQQPSQRAFFDAHEEDQMVRRLLLLDYIPMEHRKYPHKWRHALDAQNHALYYLHFKQGIAYR